MTLAEATELIMQRRHLSSYVSRWRWQRKLILAGMRQDVKVADDNYDRESILVWLEKRTTKRTTIWFTQDVRDALEKRANGEFGAMSRFVNEAVRKAIDNNRTV